MIIGFQTAIFIGGVAIFARLLGQVVYNLLFHPLRSFPGPLLSRATRLTYVYHGYSGHLHRHLRAAHEKYGSVVRIAPNELSFADAEAWKDIYGHRIGAHGGQDENEKWIVAYAGTKNAPRSLLSAPREEHASLRRLLSHGFSDRSLKQQEKMIRGHVDTLISQLRIIGENGKKLVNIRSWIAYTTFDIIGDLGFGAQFDTLRKHDHRVVPDNFATLGVKVGFFGTLRRMVLPDWFCDFYRKHIGFSQGNNPFQTYVQETVAARMQWTKSRPDLVEGLLMKGEEGEVSKSTVMLTASILVGAGFETTSSLITGCLYLLQCNPEVLQKVSHEIRSSFQSPQDITFASIDKLPYLQAVLSEALRWYPPVANSVQRQVMKGGATIAGVFVPEDTIASVPMWAASHLPANFTAPDEFRPERWLKDERFAGDKLQVSQPFVVGPRNCLGKNLANAEMRLVMTLLLYNFDFSMPTKYVGWMENQKSYQLWLRGLLEMYVKPVTMQ